MYPHIGRECTRIARVGVFSPSELYALQYIDKKHYIGAHSLHILATAVFVRLGHA